MISEYLVVSLATLAAIGIVAAAMLKGWQGWLTLKLRELDAHRGEPESGSGMARIEIADLKERIRKLEAIAAAGIPDLQIVTTCLPTAQLISCLPGVEVYIPGGLFLTRHAMVAGDRTLEEVARWNFDVALLGAEGIDENGLWNSQRDISHQQREVIRRSDEVLICMNKVKLGRGGPCAVTRDVSSLFLVTDADAASVQKAKVKLLPERVLTAL